MVLGGRGCCPHAGSGGRRLQRRRGAHPPGVHLPSRTLGVGFLLVVFPLPGAPSLAVTPQFAERGCDSAGVGDAQHLTAKSSAAAFMRGGVYHPPHPM